MKKIIFKNNKLKDSHVIIYGRHASLSAISNKDRKIKNIILAKENIKLGYEISEILKKIKKKIPIEQVEKKMIDG